MKRYSISTLLFLFVLTLTGCGSEPAAPAKQESMRQLPTWYLSPPKNSERYLYGVGEVKNLDEATRHALENMVSRFGIAIESQYRSNVQYKKDYREYFEKRTESDMKCSKRIRNATTTLLF